MLFFYYIYQKKNEIYLQEGINKFNFSVMTITRAVRQLENTGLFETKAGVPKQVYLNITNFIKVMFEENINTKQLGIVGNKNEILENIKNMYVQIKY